MPPLEQDLTLNLQVTEVVAGQGVDQEVHQTDDNIHQVTQGQSVDQGHILEIEDQDHVQRESQVQKGPPQTDGEKQVTPEVAQLMWH